jgi:hypothetical protein
LYIEEIFEAEPLYRVNPEPPYPKMARKRGYQGKVLLMCPGKQGGQGRQFMGI